MIIILNIDLSLVLCYNPREFIISIFDLGYCKLKRPWSEINCETGVFSAWLNL